MDYKGHLSVAIEAARAAGRILLAESHRASGPRGSGAHADVDAEAEVAIVKELTVAFPKYGFLCEEAHRVPSTDPENHLWIIDPNDGTSWYLKGYRGSTVSIALMRNGKLVLGVVYAFNYPTDAGDLIAWAAGCGGIRRNGVVLPARSWSRNLSVDVSVLHSPSANEKVESNAVVSAPARFRAIPSLAYRLALVAAGEAEAAVSINSPSSWDFAAGHALIQAAGGILGDDSGKQITYSADGNATPLRNCFGGSVDVVWQLALKKWDDVRSGPSIEAAANLSPRQGGSPVDAGKLDRAQGCLVGQFAGDALGELVEFQSEAFIKQKFPHGVRRLEDGGSWNTIAGQPTDDSEMALLLARSMLASRGYSQEAAACAYASWLNSGPFDVGNTVRQALYLPAGLQRKGDTAGLAEPMKKQANPISQANGSLMRISPLGVAGCDLPEDVLATFAREDAQLTHPNPVCVDANVIFTWSLAQAIRTGASPQEIYKQTCKWAAEHRLHKDILSTLEAARISKPEYMENQGWVRVALQNAYYQLLHAVTLEDGLVATVSAGGDTDTNGAIAGALLGAVHGFRNIPAQWKERVLTCRPLKGLPGVKMPRPPVYWPVDALLIAEQLLTSGRG